jgi:hypothetical protein
VVFTTWTPGAGALDPPVPPTRDSTPLGVLHAPGQVVVVDIRLNTAAPPDPKQGILYPSFSTAMPQVTGIAETQSTTKSEGPFVLQFDGQGQLTGTDVRWDIFVGNGDVPPGHPNRIQQITVSGNTGHSEVESGWEIPTNGGTSSP